MAAAGAPFSIREYTARARAGATGGSWPFSGEAGALPPMEVRRFRWWADEAAAVEEEEREVERRMAAKRRKRSVAELFAAVPRVAVGGRGKRARKGLQAKEKEKGMGKLVVELGVKQPSNGLKKKKFPLGTDVRKKEESGSVKATSISISQLFEGSVRKKNLKNFLSKKKRNQEVSVLLVKKSKKANKNSVLDSKKNAITNNVQAQCLFEKHSKVGFSTLLDDTDVRGKSNSSCKRKHVTFSRDNGTFGQTAPLPEDNTVQSQPVQTSQRPSQEGHGHRSADEDELQLVYQQADAIPAAVEEDTSSLSEIAVSAGVFCTIPVTKQKERTIVSNSVDLYHCEISNRSNYLNSISLACLSNKMPSQNFDGVYSHLDDDEDSNLHVQCLGEGNHMIPQGSPNPVNFAVKAISVDLDRSPLSQPSGSCLIDRSRSTLQERLDANCHSGTVLHKLFRSGKDVVSSMSSSTGSNKSSDARATDSVPVIKNMYFSDDYAGLPLNSRCEFMKVRPGGRSISINVFKRQYSGESSLCPSAFPTFFTPRTCTDRVNLRPNHHVPQIYTVDQSPHFTSTAPTAYEADYRQLPCYERMKTHKYAIPSNNCPSTNQQELSAVCFCSECMGNHNPEQNLLGMQNCLLRQDCEQNTEPTAEPTMRLMGKTVTLGTNGIQCRGLNNDDPGSSKQTRGDDRFFQGTCTKTFPRLFHGLLVDSPSAFRISHGERETSENSSFFSFVPAAKIRSEIDTNSFSTNGHNQQPELAAANNQYVQPVDWCNEGEIGHQQPVMTNQVQSNAEHMLLGSVQRKFNQSVASVPFRNSIRNFMGQKLAQCQSSYLAQQFSNMTQRNSMPSPRSGYAAVQSTLGLTTQTKFTSLPPLPPSLAPSHIYSPDYAQPRLSATFHPSIPVPYPASKSNAPGNAISRDERMKWAMMGSDREGLRHVNENGKRLAEKDDMFLTSPKKPFTSARKDLNLLPIPERRVQFCGSTPDARPVDTPVGFGPEPEADLLLGSQDAHHTTWSYPVNTVRPVKLKSGARHILQPSASSIGHSWTVVHSVTPFTAENAACTASTSQPRHRDL